MSQMSENLTTVRALEEDLRLPAASHAHQPNWTPVWVPVWIDGVRARAFVGNDGAYSEVIRIEFDGNMPPGELTDSFRTKYFHFPAPGRLSWGHDGHEHDILLALDHVPRT